MSRLFIGRWCAALALCAGVAHAESLEVYGESASLQALGAYVEADGLDASQAQGPPAAYSPDALAGFELGTAIEIAAEPNIDRILLLKSERRLLLLSGDLPVREYLVALGGVPEGHKRRRGDQRTPEGRYRIDWRNADSDYYRALHISYPNDDDRRRAYERGVDPGGAIMIHGLPNGLGIIGAAHRVADWTDGCVAVTNEEMDEIWERVRDGVPIEIRP